MINFARRPSPRLDSFWPITHFFLKSKNKGFLVLPPNIDYLNFWGANISLRGSSATSSQGHVFLDGRPLCNAAQGNNSPGTWNLNAANVVCRELGFSGASNYYVRSCPFGDCSVQGWIRSGIRCSGTENSILDCPYESSIASDCDAPSVDYCGVKCRTWTGVANQNPSFPNI